MKFTYLRKCTGSRPGFLYAAILYDLTKPGDPIESEVEVNCGESYTSIRRLEANGNYEGFCDGKWIRLKESDFMSILGKKRAPLVIRRRNGKETVIKDTLDFDDFINGSDHFNKRIAERFIENEQGLLAIKKYIVDNAIIIPGSSMVYKREDMDGKIAIFERDLGFLMIGKIKRSGNIVGITTYSPSKGWFHWYLKDLVKDGKTLKDFVRLKDYAKKAREMKLQKAAEQLDKQIQKYDNLQKEKAQS